MKFCLVAAFLVLVPTALAYHALPTSRILIDGDYLMAENLHTRRTFFTYLADRLHITTMQNNPRQLGETIDIKGDFSNLKRLNRPIAIDSYGYTRDYNFSCLDDRMDKDLRSLIKSCSGNIGLREMLDHERKAMQQWKEEQKKSNNPFEIAYQQKYMGIKTFGLNELVFEGIHKVDGFSINLATFDHNNTERSMWIQDENLTNSTFFIHGRPTGSNENCYGDRDDGLEPVKCKGPLVFA